MQSMDHMEPKVELTLSRSSYNIGDSVVGTVRLIAGNTIIDESSHEPSTSTCPFQGAIVYLAGKCRLDTRWHNYQKITELYGTHPILENLPIKDPTHKENSQSKQTVCFFATDFVDLMELQRSKEATETNENDQNGGITVSHSNGFTFRADLPEEIPPSANTLCCRYFYVAVAMVQLYSGEVGL